MATPSKKEIAARAYKLWEQNGQPEGREDEFWHLAEQELLNEDKSSAHIPDMATIVQCNCGAEYKRTEDKFLVPHTGDAVCTVCGAALESWREKAAASSHPRFGKRIGPRQGANWGRHSTRRV